MSTPIGRIEDHKVGIWFVCFVLCLWLGSLELISVGLLFGLFTGTVLLTILWKSVQGTGTGGFASSLVLGLVVHGPLVVTSVLVLNMIPTSSAKVDEHLVTVVGRYCIGSKQPWCRPIVNFEDDAYAGWYRARLYNSLPPDGTKYVRITTYRGLLGATVVWDRTFLNAERHPL